MKTHHDGKNESAEVRVNVYGGEISGERVEIVYGLEMTVHEESDGENHALVTAGEKALLLVTAGEMTNDEVTSLLPYIPPTSPHTSPLYLPKISPTSRLRALPTAPPLLL